MRLRKYAHPMDVGYQGWIENANGHVLAFVDLDGRIAWEW